MEPHHHLSKAKEYNKAWDNYFLHNSAPLVQDVENEANRLMGIIYGQ